MIACSDMGSFSDDIEGWKISIKLTGHIILDVVYLRVQIYGTAIIARARVRLQCLTTRTRDVGDLLPYRTTLLEDKLRYSEIGV